MGGNIAELVGSAFENWYGEKVFLDCGPEAGVESFVLEHVCPMAAATGKEILYLTDAARMQCEKERQDRADAEKVLRVMAYAEFEQMVQYHVAYDGQYDYIFAENCGVLLKSDREPAHSALVFDFLMQAQRCAVVFVGANAKGLREYLLRSGKMPQENLFELPARRPMPAQLVFVQKERGKLTGAKLAQELLLRHPGERIVYFCGSKEKLRGAAKLLKGNESYIQGGDAMEQGEILRSEKTLLVMDGRTLAPGLCLSGLRHVIVDLFEIDQMLCCLDSIAPGGSFYLYVIEYNGTQLRYLRGVFETQMRNLSWFEQMEHGEGAQFLRISQNPRFLAENPIFFIGQADEYGNCRFQVNPRQRALCEIGLAALDAISQLGYRGWVLQALGGQAQTQRYLHLPKYAFSDHQRARLLSRLEQKRGEKLAGEELETFRRYLCECFCRKSISTSTANELFEEQHIPYRLRSKKERARTSPYYNRHYWTAEPLQEGNRYE